MVISENGYGKRSDIEDYRKTNRGGKGVKTLSITEKTGKLVAIKSVTDENDLMIINKSGITIRLHVHDWGMLNGFAGLHPTRTLVRLAGAVLRDYLRE